MMKIGRSEGAKEAAQSHTGSLAGDDRVFDAVCERYGIVRVPRTRRHDRECARVPFGALACR